MGVFGLELREERLEVKDGYGKVILQFDRCKDVASVGHDFVRLRFGRVEVVQNARLRNVLRDKGGNGEDIFYLDLRSGRIYGSMPEIIRFGEFELAYIGGFLCTRTRQCYMVDRTPRLIMQSKSGLYLPLPCEGMPAEEAVREMAVRYGVYRVCLLRGDEEKVYWLVRVYRDDSVLVMDERAMHIYVWMDWQTGKLTRRELGYVRNEAERALMTLLMNDIEKDAIDRSLEKEAREVQKAERERMEGMKTFMDVEPFQMGNKWGLRQAGRIVVPPIYRTVMEPVGKYCAVESCRGIWGVIAVDGKVEVEPRYDKVEIRPDGIVELTGYKGKVVRKRLKG